MNTFKRKALTAAILGTLGLMSGCAGNGAVQYQGLSPEVAAIAAKDNKAVFQCNDTEIPNIGGGTVKSKTRSMVVDQGTIKYGNFKAETCDNISFTNENKPPAGAAPAPSK
jgi:hypothetical protein